MDNRSNIKIGYLTIDDAPSNDFESKLDYLDSKGIKAIFFCQGKFLENKIKMAVKAIQRGHVIGNHSYDHPRFSKITLEEAEWQIKRTDDLIEKAYRLTGVPRLYRVFRFPELDKGGSKKEELQKLLRSMSYRQPKFENITYRWYLEEGHHRDADVYCTYDTFDWCLLEEGGCEEFGIKTLEDVLARMDEDVPERWRGLNYPDSNDIIMVHDIEEISYAFKPMIEKMLSKGIKFELPSP